MSIHRPSTYGRLTLTEVGRSILFESGLRAPHNKHGEPPRVAPTAPLSLVHSDPAAGLIPNKAE